ncbi:MAG: glucosaminidase domain-containing protein [Bacteroidales bacterium]
MKKLFISLLIVFSLSFSTYASDKSKGSSKSANLSSSWLSYIESYKDLAILEMQSTGIPASITLAQGILESGAGKSSLARMSNNHFGIKCKSYWTGGKVYYTDDAPNECFRSYDNVYDSYKDHSQFLVNSSRYSSLFSLRPTDYKGWAKGLKAAGYATAPDYAHRLISIIENYDLHQYDNVSSKNAMLLASANEKAIHNSIESSSGSTKVYHKDFKESDRVEINAFQKRNIFEFNKLLAIEVKDGDTFKSLAKELGLSVHKLCKYNDYPSSISPRKGEVLYIERKNKKGKKGLTYHTVDTNENMFYISQKYGIRLKSLLKINEMRPGEIPYEGQIIYLRN